MIYIKFLLTIGSLVFAFLFFVAAASVDAEANPGARLLGFILGSYHFLLYLYLTGVFRLGGR